MASNSMKLSICLPHGASRTIEAQEGDWCFTQERLDDGRVLFIVKAIHGRKVDMGEMKERFRSATQARSSMEEELDTTLSLKRCAPSIFGRTPSLPECKGATVSGGSSVALSNKTSAWNYDFEELCVCGHPGYDHCLDDCCCCWNPNKDEWGGACFAPQCDCTVYRPKSVNPGEK